MMKPKKEALDIATLYNRWLNECERIKSPWKRRKSVHLSHVMSGSLT